MRAILLLLGFLLVLPLPAFAWGPRGHQVVAHIAAMNLSPRARATVADLLGGQPEAMLALSANWADEIRDARPQTGPWHYVNLKITGDLRYRAARDCPRDNCIVAQIARQEAVLRSQAPRAQKAEALKYLIHFIGDIHQPLHAADNEDRGGNRVQMRWRGQRITLHHFWDDEMVSLWGRDAHAIARSIDSATPRARKAALGTGTPVEWVQHSAAIAREKIYPQAGRTPTQKEAAEFGRIAREQMAQAGFALAARLNAIYQ
jgi:hypothetical protein